MMMRKKVEDINKIRKSLSRSLKENKKLLSKLSRKRRSLNLMLLL
jgi:hypothetical protein